MRKEDKENLKKGGELKEEKIKMQEIPNREKKLDLLDEVKKEPDKEKKQKLEIELPPHDKKHHLEKEPLEKLEKLELMIELSGNKHELIKTLNDVNAVLLENCKEHYNFNVKKRK